MKFYYKIINKLDRVLSTNWHKCNKMVWNSNLCIFRIQYFKTLMQSPLRVLLLILRLVVLILCTQSYMSYVPMHNDHYCPFTYLTVKACVKDKQIDLIGNLKKCTLGWAGNGKMSTPTDFKNWLGTKDRTRTDLLSLWSYYRKECIRNEHLVLLYSK